MSHETITPFDVSRVVGAYIGSLTALENAQAAYDKAELALRNAQDSVRDCKREYDDLIEALR